MCVTVNRQSVQVTFGRGHRALNIFIVAAIPFQLYLVGLGLFASLGFKPHAMFGWAIVLAGVLSSIAAALAGRRQARPLLALGLTSLILLQPVLVYLPRRSLSFVSALHAVNAVAILSMAVRVELSMLANRVIERREETS